MKEKFKNFFSKLRLTSWALPVLMVIIGLLFVFIPDTSLYIICRVIGIALVVIGIIISTYYFATGMKFNSKLLMIGIALVAAGIYFYVKSEALAEIIMVLLGICIIIDGIIKIQNAVDAYRLKMKGWGFPIAVSIITIIVGIIILVNPFESAKTILVFIGAVLIYQGAIDLINNKTVVKNIKKRAIIIDEEVDNEEENRDN